jgi:hypothetical protein
LPDCVQTPACEPGAAFFRFDLLLTDNLTVTAAAAGALVVALKFLKRFWRGQLQL